MKTKFQDVPQFQRIQMLQDSCDKIEERSYMKVISAAEMSKIKDEIADNSLMLSNADDEKKAFLEAHKIHVKPLKDKRKTLLQSAKQKSEYVKEALFCFLEHDLGVAQSFTPAGECVEERPLRPEERQTTVFMQANRAFDKAVNN